MAFTQQFKYTGNCIECKYEIKEVCIRCNFHGNMIDQTLKGLFLNNRLIVLIAPFTDAPGLKQL